MPRTPKLNNVPPEGIEQLRKHLDEGMSRRSACAWLSAEYGVDIGSSTLQRWYSGSQKVDYVGPHQPPTLKMVLEKKLEKTAGGKILGADGKVKSLAKRRLDRAGDIKIGKKVVSSEDILDDESYDDLRNEENKRNVAWKPFPKQSEFLSASETDVLFGGAAGPGKSEALIIDPLRLCTNKKHRALILRRSLKELRELMEKARDLYPMAFPKAVWRESEKLWRFPSGARIEFGYLEKDGDVYQYQGQEFTWIGFDELTQLPTEFPWNYLFTRLRTTDPDLLPHLAMRATTNPGEPGHVWVKERYIDKAPWGQAFVFNKDRFGRPLTRRFIPAALADNPILWKDGRYEATLQSMPEIERRRLLEGDWDILEGQAFPEFEKAIHVIEPYRIPRVWKHFRGVDYGFSAPACVLWGAVDPTDGTLIIYRELYKKGLTGEALAEAITEAEKEDPPMGGVVDTAVFNKVGFQNTIGQALNSVGLKLIPANKDRKAGKVQIHERLSTRNKDRPGVQIFSTCHNLIRELSTIPLKDNDPEDVDTHADDHAYDALRYMCMKEPRQRTVDDWLLFAKKQVSYNDYIPADPLIGY